MQLILILVFTLFSSISYSQDYRFRMEGSYSLTPDFTPKPVNFKMQWNENNGAVKGTYVDDYFNVATNLEGVANSGGRTFNVIFPDIIHGAKNITFLSSQTDAINGSIPLSITVRNEIGDTILVYNTSGIMVSVNPSTGQDGKLCSIGFGALTGFCGLYAGGVTEVSDPANRCDLIGNGSLRLELGTDKSLSIYIRYLNSTQGIPVHKIGTLPSDQLDDNVNLRGRNCGSLPGTSFFSGHCQTLILTGGFNSGQGFSHSFSGTYTIIDEVTAESCQLNLIMERTIAY